MARQLALTRAAKTLNESLDLATLLGRICEEAIGAARRRQRRRLPRHAGRRASSSAASPACRRSSSAGRWQPGTGLAGKVRRARPPDAHQRLPARSPTLPADSPFAARARPRSRSRSAWDGELRGVLSRRLGARRTASAREDLAVLETFAELAAVACRNASAHAGLARAAPHRRAHRLPQPRRAARAASRARSSAPRAAPPSRSSLVLIDLDHFKQVNERARPPDRRRGAAPRRHRAAQRHPPLRPRRPLRRRRVRADRRRRRRGRRRSEIAARARRPHRAPRSREFVEGDAAGATAGVAEWTPGPRRLAS